MKKSFLVLFLGLFAFPIALSAQTEEGTFQLVSFDIGYAPSFTLSDSKMDILQSFALNVRVSDNFTVGFQTYNKGTAALPLLNMKYDFLPGKARGTIAFGKDDGTAAVLFSNSAPVAGFGFEYIPFTRNVAGSVTTEFKIGVQYLFTTADVSKGAVVFNIAFGLGI